MTQISREATTRLRAAADRRTAMRDREIRRVGARIDRWTADLEVRLLGLVAAGRGGLDGVMGSVDVVLMGAIEEGADLIQAGLQSVWERSWLTVTRDWVAALPLSYWLRRLVPLKMLLGTECFGPGVPSNPPRAARSEVLGEYGLDAENLWAKILAGEVTEKVAREIVRNAEFGSPLPDQVDAILSATNAADGMSAMQRIKTVLQKDLGSLRTEIRTAMSGEFDGASAVSALTNRIKPLLDTNEGINYKAKRIARTEGVRVAEAAMRESWKPLGDMLKGIRTWTAGDGNVRDSHQHWHGKLFLRTDAGARFVARDGEALPEFPAGPNCRCYTAQELIDELYADSPRSGVDYGAYNKGMARFRRQVKPKETVS